MITRSHSECAGRAEGGIRGSKDQISGGECAGQRNVRGSGLFPIGYCSSTIMHSELVLAIDRHWRAVVIQPLLALCNLHVK